MNLTEVGRFRAIQTAKAAKMAIELFVLLAPTCGVWRHPSVRQAGLLDQMQPVFYNTLHFEGSLVKSVQLCS